MWIFFFTYTLMYSVPESGRFEDDIYPEVKGVFPFLLSFLKVILWM